MAWSEGLDSQVILLQTFMGLAMVIGTLVFGCIMVNRSKQCVVSPQYLLQISLLGIGGYYLTIGWAGWTYGYRRC